MNTDDSNSAKVRLYYLDWLRVLAFSLLVFYHAGLIFVDWGYHIQNNEYSEWMKLPMLFVNQWRLPLIFFVSGAGIRFALGRRTGGEFLKERFVRLFIPLVFGILVVIPPQVYFELLGKQAFQGSYTRFYPEYFNGHVTWNHLWYIVYLLAFVVIASPLFIYLRGKRGQSLMQKPVSFFAANRMSLSMLVIPLFLVEFALRDAWPDKRNLISDWYNFSFYFIILLYGYFIASNASLWDIIENDRFIYFVFGIISFLMIYLGRHQAGENFLETTDAGILIFKFFKCLNILSWILCCLGFARHYLDFNNRLLQYTNRAVYPFYILHQTVLIAIGYYVIMLETDILMKYVLIVSGTFIVTMLLYDLIIRRTKLTKLFFGIK